MCCSMNEKHPVHIDRYKIDSCRAVRAPRGQSDLGAVKVTSKFRDNLSNSPRLPEKPRACPHFTQAEVMYCLNRHKALEAKLVT